MMSISVIGGSCFTVKELKLNQLVGRPRTEDGRSISMAFWNKKVQAEPEVEQERNLSLAYWNKKVEEELERKQKMVSRLREQSVYLEDETLLRSYKDPTEEDFSSISTGSWNGSHPAMVICNFSTVAILIVIVIVIFALIVKYSKYVNGKE